MARRAVVTRPGKKIDFKNWNGLPAIDLNSSAAATILGSSLAFAIPATILRVRGQVLVLLDNAAVGVTQGVAMGLAVISSDAFAAGVVAVPDPAGELDYPWLWWNSVKLFTDSGASIDNFGMQYQRVEVDSKAMRKMKPGESLVFIAQTLAAVGVTRINVAHIRVLIGT